MKKMRKQLIDLLNVHGVSGQEASVRGYLKPILEKLVDEVHVDSYGNLLGDKVCGNGKGATVLLSAHMDTVKGVLKDRKLIEKNGVISSSEGALGADDRAGIAIILTVLENLETLGFNGKIKVSFSREEEIGCVGVGKINPKWYAGTDLAIVVDRRGSRDIVVGCGGAFCSDSVGTFLENVGKLADMSDWRCVEGGISDALTFSEKGINSVNLSAGYNNEHTKDEYVVLAHMKDTAKFILQTIAVINDICHTFEPVGYENSWVKSWYGKGSKMTSYFEDTFGEDIWAEETDKHGDVYVYEMGEDIIIQQKEKEIVLTRESLRSLVDQLGYI
jgi:putative aminopeptidase FrvX